MTLLLDADSWARRTSLAAGPLAPLADSLAHDLEPWLARPLHVPTRKALLSRIGGRCEVDGTDLAFDPASPHAHRCPACGRTFGGEWHDRWWIYPYQLWLAERIVHAATLHALRGDSRHELFAATTLGALADAYPTYPNADNVLGPSRPFFSTYLESLWLLHLCIATDSIDPTGATPLGARVRERIIEPSVALIEQYDEGLSNRQVWNLVAIAAARRLLGRDPEPAFVALDELIAATMGIDGAWYEGDNYHQFAHRGLWYAFALADRAGFAFSPRATARFDAGFRVPFLTALPDFTVPARKDSRYAVSLRQWRFAEWCELGVARTDDPTLRWALARIYDADAPPGETGRATSSGEAERPVPAARLTRADLGWKSLLYARAALPALDGTPPSSVTVESQGYTVHRRDGGSVYVALDWGENGGGHGHPDRLNLVIARGAERVLDDLGTGSYVDPSLHWYRSTLAHNAPLVDGRSQARTDGWRLTQGSADGVDWIAAACAPADGVVVERTLVTADGYAVDELRWQADHDARVELPLHVEGHCDLPFVPATLDGGDGVEDGFSWVRDARAASLAPGAAFSITTGEVRATVHAPGGAVVFRASAPGQPATVTRSFLVVRQSGRAGVVRSAWAWRPAIVTPRPDGFAVECGGARHEHRSDGAAWTIQSANGAPVTFVRDGRPPHHIRPEPAARAHEAIVVRRVAPGAWYDPSARDASSWWVQELGARHYRRTDEAWGTVGRPAARVAIAHDGTSPVVDVEVRTPAPVFVPAGAENPLDNEAADINGHGVQCYFAANGRSGGFVCVPDGDGVRVRRIPEWGDAHEPTAQWRPVAGGFVMRLRLPPAATDFALDLIVNDAAQGRMRRRGQLVLSGAGGEWAWLRGDRHDPARLLSFRVAPRP